MTQTSVHAVAFGTVHDHRRTDNHADATTARCGLGETIRHDLVKMYLLFLASDWPYRRRELKVLEVEPILSKPPMKEDSGSEHGPESCLGS
jgi:hypothetical protein